MTTGVLAIVGQVTREHGETFAEAFLDRAFGSEAMLEAFSDVRLLTWPSGDATAQEVYHNLADAILESTFAMVKPAIIEAFVMAATVILAREREASSSARAR